MDNKKIGNYLASKRLAKGLTQEQLAARIYVSPKTISKWERGRGLPDVSNLEPLCAALGISIAAFLRGEDEAPALDERTESDILDLLSAREVYRKRVRALLPLGLSLCCSALAPSFSRASTRWPTSSVTSSSASAWPCF